MIRLELRRLETIRLANVCALIYAVIMLVVMILFSPVLLLTSMMGAAGGGGADALFPVGLSFAMVLLYPIIGLISGWIGGIIVGLVYNLVVRWIGGLTFDFVEVEGAVRGTHAVPPTQGAPPPPPED